VRLVGSLLLHLGRRVQVPRRGCIVLEADRGRIFMSYFPFRNAGAFSLPVV